MKRLYLGIKIEEGFDALLQLVLNLLIPGLALLLLSAHAATHGDGVYTVVVQVPGASEAETIAQRYGATTRFRQGFEDMANSGNYLEEIDLSVFGLPLTFLSTNLP